MSTSLAAARSFLFAPGSDEHKLSKALPSDADVVIADLEDAVAPRVWPDLADGDGLAGRTIARARSLRFRGKACIHQVQLEPVTHGLLPTASELAWADRVVTAHERGSEHEDGAIVLAAS